MSMVLPTVGASLDVWGTIINTALTLNDAHDHTTGKGVKVPSAGLNINADVAWNSGGTYYGLTGVKILDFQPQAAAGLTAFSSALFSNSTDANNLYYRNASGVNVKITDGSTLNVSIVGGIGGDYSSIGALLDYDDASDTYRFRQQNVTVRQYAHIAAGDVDLYEYKAPADATAPTNRVRLSSPAALAASYALTFPAALPGSTLLQQVSSAGVISWSNTVANAVAMSASLTVGTTLAVTGATTLTGGIANNVNLAAGATVPAGQTFDVNGVLDAKDATNLLWPVETSEIDISAGRQQAATATYDGNMWAFTGGGTAAVDIPVNVPNGYRVTAAVVRLKRASGTVTATLYTRDDDGTTAGLTSRGTISVIAGTSYANATIASLPYTMTGAENGAFVRVTGLTGTEVAGLRVSTDKVV
jgi:hypothetical protein